MSHREGLNRREQGEVRKGSQCAYWHGTQRRSAEAPYFQHYFSARQIVDISGDEEGRVMRPVAWAVSGN